MNATETFRAARDFFPEYRTDYVRAYRDFRWPRFEYFNWAIDWFDIIARDNVCTALRIVSDGGLDLQYSFEELRRRSNRVANYLRRLGVR